MALKWWQVGRSGYGTGMVAGGSVRLWFWNGGEWDSQIMVLEGWRVGQERYGSGMVSRLWLWHGGGLNQAMGLECQRNGSTKCHLRNDEGEKLVSRTKDDAGLSGTCVYFCPMDFFIKWMVRG